MFSEKELSKTNIKNVNFISEYQYDSNLLLDEIDLNFEEDLKKNLLIISDNYNINSAKIYQSPKIELLPTWTFEEYSHFENMLKNQNESTTKNRWEYIKLNKLDSHTFKEYIELFKFIRNQLLEKKNFTKQLQDINQYINKNFYKITNNYNLTNYDNNLLLINFSMINKPSKINFLQNTEKCKFIIIYGLDVMIKNMNIKPEEIYIKMINLIKLHGISSPNIKNILFCDTKFKWGFSLSTFAMLYNEFFSLTVEETIEKLWGENYYDSKKNIWLQFKKTDIKRSFCQYILIPIRQLYFAITSNNISRINEILNNLKIDTNKYKKPDLDIIIEDFSPFQKNFAKLLLKI